ncbi:trace amine-associated receptor 4 isoform X4 [Oryzias melastigma]|uniref:trace amine-associated receptor 4 isoform X4 n=1 Tax=Oryzias melastigma TaxID=30732 RepID=UPI000CF8173D|nr:trace amine-associated receptor 4 isoform X4 [Oryzias melastigma]
METATIYKCKSAAPLHTALNPEVDLGEMTSSDRKDNFIGFYVLSYIHPCYTLQNGTYIFMSNPSYVCALLYIFLGFLSFVTSCGNLLVITSIVYFKQLHTPTNYLILSLAVADLLVGVLVFPSSMAVTVSSCMHRQEFFCKIRDSFDITLCTASILNLCCISIDRYYAVCQPLTYVSNITAKVTAIMILVSWGISVFIGITITVAGFSQGSSQKQVNSIQNASSSKCGAEVSKMERKATKTLAIVMGVFLLCLTPYFICVVFQPLFVTPPQIPVIETLNWLALSNSLLNPLIYAFFYSWFRDNSCEATWMSSEMLQKKTF